MEKLGYGNILQNCFENLLIAEKQLQDKDVEIKESPYTSLEQFWKDIDIASKKLSFECTKLCLSFTSEPLPTAHETSSLLQNIEQAAITLISVALRFDPSFGRVLRGRIFTSSVNAIHSVRQLVRLIKDDGGAEVKERYQQATGVAWEGCRAIENCPKNNKEAVLSSLKELCLLISDAFDEITEALKGDGKGWNNLGLSGSDSDSEGESSWSEKDKLTIDPTVNIIKAAKILYTKLVTAVEKNASSETKEHNIELDELLEDCNSSSLTVDSLILEIYPPVNVANLEMQSHTLASNLLTTLKTAGRSHVITEEERASCEFIQTAVDHNLNKMKEILKDL